jgi:creatinine amidohydrolase/Fe(II)-dependent formamide hydrolase-like protein
MTDGDRQRSQHCDGGDDLRSGAGRGRPWALQVVVPFGAVEQHGAHLPLDTDAVLADRLGPLLAERLDGLCAPTMRIGCSQHHLAFPGTLSLRRETLQRAVHDLIDSLARHGFRRIVLFATHGGNEGPLQDAAAAGQRDGVTVLVPSLRVAVEACSWSRAPGACHPGKPADTRVSSRHPSCWRWLRTSCARPP